MLPTSRCVGGIAKSRGGPVERLKVVQSLSPGTKARRVSSHPDAVDATQWSRQSQHPHIPIQESEVRAALRCETSSAQPNTGNLLFGNTEPQSIPASQIDPAFFARSTPQQPSFAHQQTRGFHTSPHVPYDSTSYNVTTVPDFFVKYSHQRTALPEMHERSGLMPSLTDAILSGDVVATTRRLKAKIPVEHQIPEGHIVHPSGFVVPGPGHTSTSDVARAKEKERNENKDRAVQTAAVAHRVLESDFEQVDATTLPSAHKVPFEVREPDGTVKHPSGFVPPTPAHKFRHTVNTGLLRDRKASDARQRPRQPSPARAVLRAMHTSVPKTSGDA